MQNVYSSSLNKPIYDITSFTQVDYPGQMACIVWFAGCNMQCPYCYNPNIVKTFSGSKTIEDLFKFLKQRQNLLDAVVLSGGECSLYPHLPSLIKDIKALGYKVKVDTNGTNPNNLPLKDIDFVALDIKATAAKYKAITTKTSENTYKTLDLLVNSSTPFECRTTIHTALLTEMDIIELSNDLYNKGYRGTHYLQLFQDTETLGNIKESREYNLEHLHNKTKLHLEIRS